jgi:hypothetical protein
MKAGLGFVTCLCLFLFAAQGRPQDSDDSQNRNIPLVVPQGTPLRLYLTKRISKRAGDPVEAKVLEPVYAFDRVVIPPGTTVLGRVARLVPVSKWQRASAMMNGDFTPLHRADVEFTTLVMADGRKIGLHTNQTPGLNSLVSLEPQKPKKPKKQKQTAKQPAQNQTPMSEVLGMAKQTVKDRINGQLNARTHGMADIVRGPNKKERFTGFVMAKLPYHPQWVRRGTRFDAELQEPLQFGSEAVKTGDFALLGTQPSADSVVQARLTTALDSAVTKPGEAVTALVTQPLYSPEHKLILPEGTRLEGAVVVAKRARHFHRGGQLRFNFQRVDLPPEAAALRPVEHPREPMRTQAILQSAAPDHGPIKVDSEGGVQATESKTRFIAPAISLVIARQAADNDAGHVNGGSSNVGGRTLGGASGFGLLGMAVSQSSRYVGMAFGYYGMAWSAYTNLVSRGTEVQFGKNSVVEIRFGARTPTAGSKLHGD